jgi:NAD(P)-dependent dehydrogenase (short-subunit alcohol dehydrogenase family)
MYIKLLSTHDLMDDTELW